MHMPTNGSSSIPAAPQSFFYTCVGTEGDTFSIPLLSPQPSVNYGADVSLAFSATGSQYIVNAPPGRYTPTTITVITGSPVVQGDQILVLITPTATQAPVDFGLIIIAGQSNAVGLGDTDKADTGLSIKTPFASCIMNEQGGSGDPISWSFSAPTEALQPYAPGGQRGMGPELSLGRALVANKWQYAPWIGKFAVDATGLGDMWIPGAVYPTTGGPDLYTQLVSYIRARQIESGKTIGALVWVQGEHDAASAPLSAAYQANLVTFVTALRALFGPFAFVFNETNINLTAAPDLAAVRSAQVAYAAADANSALILDDDLPLLADLTHYTSDSYITLGNRIAVGVMSLKAPPTPPTYSTPTYIGADSGLFVATGGAGAISPRWGGPIPYAANDIGIMVVATSGGATVPVTLTTAQGFTLIGDSEFNFAGIFERVTLYWCRATSGNMTAPTVTPGGSTTQAAARIFVFRGCYAGGSPIDVSSTDGQYGTALSIAGATTLGANRLVCAFMAGLTGTQGTVVSGQTNASLSALAKQQDSIYAPSGNYQMITLITGFLAIAGTYVATTATTSSNVWKAGMTIALKPVAG